MKRGLIVILSLILFTTAASAKSRLKIGEPIPEFTLKDLKGFELRVPEQLKGRVFIIHFWADWCTYCLEEMPALDRIYRRYKRKGLEIIAINVGQKEERVNAFLKNVKVSYRVLLDRDMKVAKTFNVLGLPRTFFIDRRGRLRFRILGDATEATLERLVKKIIR
ncbi:MAG: TlpA family protein disulfide reductase [Nitrospirae bacterium]|nr:MAG: TlpA family protein disulfide reductase [Nitrospirota bacterium]